MPGTGKSSIWSEWWILLHRADAWCSAHIVHTFVLNSIFLTGLEFSFTSADLLCPWHWLLINFNFIWNCTKVCIASFINSSHLIYLGSLGVELQRKWTAKIQDPINFAKLQKYVCVWGRGEGKGWSVRRHRSTLWFGSDTGIEPCEVYQKDWVARCRKKSNT